MVVEGSPEEWEMNMWKSLFPNGKVYSVLLSNQRCGFTTGPCRQEKTRQIKQLQDNAIDCQSDFRLLKEEGPFSAV
jgi:hypothetical protein